MATEIQIYVGDFFRLIEAKTNNKYCDVCSKHFNRTAYYKHIKSNIHNHAIQKIISSNSSPNK